MNELFIFLQDYKYLWGALFFIKGAAITFFGRVAIKPTVFVVSFILSAFFLMLTIYSIFGENERKEWVNWTVLGGCLIAGAVIGTFMVKFLKFGIALLGAFAGISLGLLLSSSIQISNGWIFWAILIGFGGLTALLTFKLRDHILIFSTALLGSFLLVRGVGFYAGNYPSPFELRKEIQAGAWDAVPTSFYIYLGCNIVVFLMGVFF
mmetsp:Transcript_35880/g.55076  ORF Transcript_35880/g.55076 Transcript_35880/m.55076 type:complete len:207 (-) Transcript_35880:105-725(-)